MGRYKTLISDNLPSHLMNMTVLITIVILQLLKEIEIVACLINHKTYIILIVVVKAV